jgi:hypothetical protein
MMPQIAVHSLQRLLARFSRSGRSPRNNTRKRWIDPISHQPPQHEMTASARAAILLRACVCIRLNDLNSAEAILCGTGLAEPDAARLNLLGIICELLKQRRAARNFYRWAIRHDRPYEPPRQNLRRLYELHTFGQSREHVNLGDEDPQLWAQRVQFLRCLETNLQHRRELVHHDN